MITEFGGVSLSAEGAGEEDWGYSNATSGKEYAELLRGLFDALRASDEVSGFCYTQYIDTGQETNGLLFKDGTPKISLETIREIVTGDPGPASVATSDRRLGGVAGLVGCASQPDSVMILPVAAACSRAAKSRSFWSA